MQVQAQVQAPLSHCSPKGPRQLRNLSGTHPPSSQIKGVPGTCSQIKAVHRHQKQPPNPDLKLMHGTQMFPPPRKGQSQVPQFVGKRKAGCVSQRCCSETTSTLGGRNVTQGGKKRGSQRKGDILEGVDHLSAILSHT